MSPLLLLSGHNRTPNFLRWVYTHGVVSLTVYHSRTVYFYQEDSEKKKKIDHGFLHPHRLRSDQRIQGPCVRRWSNSETLAWLGKWSGAVIEKDSWMRHGPCPRGTTLTFVVRATLRLSTPRTGHLTGHGAPYHLPLLP